MAFSLGGTVGGLPKGFSNPSPRFNYQTGQYETSAPVWVGGGSGPSQADQSALLQMQQRFSPTTSSAQFITKAQSDAAQKNPAYGQRIVIGGQNQGAYTPGQVPASALGGSGSLNSAVQTGQTQVGVPATNGMGANGGQVGQSPANGMGTGGGQGANPGMGGMANAINQNPSGLEQYWNDNPAELRKAISQNPAMFAPAGLARDGNTEAPTGLQGSEQAMYGGLLGGMEQLNKGVAGAEGAYNQFGDAAKGSLAGYAQQGQGASQYQTNLSGANGPEAQAQAFAQYQESPEQAYLREQSERAITRNAAATGGLGGGNVLKELQRNATGLAAQDFQNSFNRLNTVADRGFNASQGISAIDAGMGIVSAE